MANIQAVGKVGDVYQTVHFLIIKKGTNANTLKLEWAINNLSHNDWPIPAIDNIGKGNTVQHNSEDAFTLSSNGETITVHGNHSGPFYGVNSAVVSQNTTGQDHPIVEWRCLNDTAEFIFRKPVQTSVVDLDMTDWINNGGADLRMQVSFIHGDPAA